MPAQRKAAQSAIELAELRHVERDDLEAERLDRGARAWIAVGDKHVLVHAQRIRGVALLVRDLDDFVRGECR